MLNTVNIARCTKHFVDVSALQTRTKSTEDHLVHVLQVGRRHLRQLGDVKAVLRVPAHRQLRPVVVADQVVQALIIYFAVGRPVD